MRIEGFSSNVEYGHFLLSIQQFSTWKSDDNPQAFSLYIDFTSLNP